MKETGLLLGSWLLGSVPFGLLIARWWAGIDVRQHGSGNIGATNVYRVVGKPAGAVVLALDVLKGLIPPLAAGWLGLFGWWPVLAGLASIAGHNASPFLGFHGGKGVATSLGVLLGIAWPVGLTALALWALLVALTGYVSVGSIAAAVALPPLCLLYYPGDLPRLAFCLVASAFSLYKHRGNIQRLRSGTENSIRRRPVSPGDSGPASH